MNEHYESIMRGLQEAVDYVNGDKSKGFSRKKSLPDVIPAAEYSKDKNSEDELAE